MPLITLIIPCFNQGDLLKEALQSLEECDKSLFEIIIINDGSTDELTNNTLKELADDGINVIFQSNTGLGQARNNGIKEAKGKYILPLDSDNRIRAEYLTKGIQILENDDKTAVVYGNAQLFGDKSGVLRPGKFNLQMLMLRNYIDACAIIRKSVFEEVGRYDNMKIMGLEDWDLWLRIAFAGYKFHYIDEIMFDYRVTEKSMIRKLNADIEKRNSVEEYMSAKYPDKLSAEGVFDYFVYKFKRRPFQMIRKLVLRKYFPAYYSKLIRENKIYRNDYYD
jgi:glycosyltransferase involved in cell wall biosynthesis